MSKRQSQNQPRYKFISAIVIAMTVLLAGGCVYYNTFYNAQKAFDEAEKARKSSRYSQNQRINQQQYTRAIEKALKVIENHPDSKYYDDALYVLAVSYYYTEKPFQAERRFREILANYADSKYADDAELYLAKTKLEMGEEPEAMELFQEIFNSKASRDFKTEAAMALGNYHFKNKSYRDALPYYQAVRDSLGNDPEKKLAQRYIADGYFNTFRFADALKAYLQILGMNPDKDERYLALYHSAVCSFRLMRINDGMDYLNTLIDDELYYDSLNTLKMEVAQGWEYDDRVDLAEEVYREVAADESNRKLAGLANYRLGLIYQFDYDSLLQAKEFYDATAKLSRNTEYGNDALQRSSDIGKLETFARKEIIDSTSSQAAIDEAAYTQYQLAELYWLKLNKPDTAIMEMQYVVDSFPAAYDAPRALIALSQMYLDHMGDSAASDSILHLVLEKYPHSDDVKLALEALGLLGTEADTGYAQKYVNQAEDYVIAGEHLDSARALYQHVVDNFPGSQYYLRSKFSLIWMDEQFFSPGDSSVIYAYNEFIDSFPSTQWAQEARGRLQGVPLQKPAQELDGGEGADSLALADLGDESSDPAISSRLAEQDTSDTYIDPLANVYIDPNGKKIPNMPYPPIEVLEEFVYPTEAYRLEWEGDLYYQIFLDFSGEVIDYIQKTFSESEEINRDVSRTIASMTFDVGKIPLELQGGWFVYKFEVRKPDKLR